MEDVLQPQARKEVESRFKNRSSAIIGTEARFSAITLAAQNSLSTRRVGQDVKPCGPKLLPATSSLGQQLDSRKRTEGSTVISAKDPRFLLYGDSSSRVALKRFAKKDDASGGEAKTGEALVPPQSSMGKQPLSTKRSAGAFSFGASKRTAYSHATPNAIIRDVAAAQDKLSTRRRAPKHSFGVGGRFQKNRLFGQIVDRSPGPCGYDADAAYRKIAAGSVLTPKWATGKKPEKRDKSGRTSTRFIYRF